MPRESELARQMQRIRAANTRKPRSETSGASQEAMAIKALIDPVVTEFIEADEALMIQSAKAASYFISYGLAYVCRVEVSIKGAYGSVTLSGDPGFAQSYSFDLDTVDNADVKRQVKEGLLAWYKSCFS